MFHGLFVVTRTFAEPEYNAFELDDISGVNDFLSRIDLPSIFIFMVQWSLVKVKRICCEFPTFAMANLFTDRSRNVAEYFLI